MRAVSRAVSCGQTSPMPAPQPVTASIAMAHAALDSDNPEQMRTALSALLAAIETGQVPDPNGVYALVALGTQGGYVTGYSDAATLHYPEGDR